MEIFETLVFIFVIIETVQVYYLLKNNRALKKMVEEILTNKEYASEVATNMLFGAMERIKDNKKDQEVFFGFIQHCGAHAFAGAKAAVGDVVGGGVDLPKRHALKPFEGILNQVLPGLFENAKKKAKATAAEEASAAGVPGW